MAVWRLEAYDTETRTARYREYTASKRRAKAWEQIPRIQFTDSGHGIVFQARPHIDIGSRLPTIGRRDWAEDKLREAKREASAT